MAIEFVAELDQSGTLTIPPDAAARLPKGGRVRVIVVSGADADDQSWFAGAYQQFLRDDSSEDEMYQSLR